MKNGLVLKTMGGHTLYNFQGKVIRTSENSMAVFQEANRKGIKVVNETSMIGKGIKSLIPNVA